MPPEITNQLSFPDLFRLSLRIFKTKPVRTILTILGMAVGIGTVVFLISLGYGLQYILIGKLVTTQDSLITLEASFPAESNLPVDRATVDAVSKLDGASEISTVAEFPAEVKMGDSTSLVIAKIVQPNYFRLSGITPDVGTIFKEGEPGVIISNQTAKLLNLAPDASTLGKQFNFKVSFQSDQADKAGVPTTESDLSQPLILKGIINDDTQPPFAYIPQSYLVTEPPFFKSILVKAKDINSVETLKDKLIEKGFVISARVDLVNQATKVMNIITTILGVFGIAALAVSAIGMFNTMIVSFMERTYEVGIMKSIGATDRDVKNLFLMESFVMGFLGGSTGVAIGMGGGGLVNFGLGILAQHLGGKPFTLFITPLWFAGMTIALSSLIGVISGFWPAIRASYLSPKEAFKNR